VVVTGTWALIIAALSAVALLFLGDVFVGLFTDLTEVLDASAIYLPWLVFWPMVSVWSYQLDGIFIGATATAPMEASLDLGAGHWRTFFSVVFPLTWHGAVSGIIIVFIPGLGAFFIPELLGGTDSQLIGNVIERQFKSANDWPFGAALSFLLMYATFGALALRSLLSGRNKGLEV